MLLLYYFNHNLSSIKTYFDAFSGILVPAYFLCFFFTFFSTFVTGALSAAAATVTAGAIKDKEINNANIYFIQFSFYNNGCSGCEGAAPNLPLETDAGAYTGAGAGAGANAGAGAYTGAGAGATGSSATLIFSCVLP